MAVSQDPPSLTPVFQEPEPADPRPEPLGGGPGPVGATKPRPAGARPEPLSATKPRSVSAGPGAADAGPAPAEVATEPAGAGDPVLGAGDPVLIVDGANVVGSVPDGWWRDRAGAAIRLRDNLAGLPASGLPGLPAPVEVVLVVEGRARDIPQGPSGVRIERATGSGDDKIVDLVRVSAPARRTVVVTADRGLRDRVTALGAEVRGPSAVPR